MRKLVSSMTAAVVLAVSLSVAAQAQFTPVVQPGDGTYLIDTTLLTLPPPTTYNVGSVSDAYFTATFSPIAQYAGSIPDGWATWGSPPDTESATPGILYFPTAGPVTISFSSPVSVFGFEAEPNDFNLHPMSALFYSGASLVGTVPLVVNGSYGARLFAAYAGPGASFDSVVISTDDTTGFAIGQLRYGQLGPDPVPEAGTLAGLGSMVGFGLLWLRRRSAA